MQPFSEKPSSLKRAPKLNSGDGHFVGSFLFVVVVVVVVVAFESVGKVM